MKFFINEFKDHIFHLYFQILLMIFGILILFKNSINQREEFFKMNTMLGDFHIDIISKDLKFIPILLSPKR